MNGTSIALVAAALCLSPVGGMAVAAAPASDAETIAGRIRAAYAAFAKRDIDGAQDIYVRGDRLVVYDMFPKSSTDASGYNQVAAPQAAASDNGREQGYDALYKKVAQQIASTAGPILSDLSDLDVVVDHDHAYSRYMVTLQAKLLNGQPVTFKSRVTDVWEKQNGTWFVVMEHASYPPR